MSCLYSSQGFHNIHHYISIFILFEVYFVHGVRKFSSFIFMVEGTFPVSSIVAVTNIHSKHPWRMVPLSAHPLQHLLFVVVESLSHVRLFVTPWTAARQAPLSFTISSSVVPFSSSLQSFPALGSFQVSQFFASGGQSIGVSASTSVLPMNSQD